MPYLLSLHFINTWKPYTSEDGLPVREFPDRTSSKIVWDLMQYMPIPVIFLATLGLIATLRKWKELLIIYLIILLTIAQNIVFYGSMRFRAPIEPMLVILAAGAIWWFTYNEAGTLRSLFQNKKRSAMPSPNGETSANATTETATR